MLRLELARIGLIVAVVLAAAANAWAAEDGERRVAADVERFLRAGMDTRDREDDRVTIDLPPLAAFAVDRARFPGPLRTEITTRSTKPFQGRIPLAVALYAGDVMVNRAIVTPSVRSTERVLVPVRHLSRGSLLEPEDFRLVEMDAQRIPRDALQDISAIFGLRARQSLREGRALRANQVEGVPLVERGDRVQLILEAGALRINATGEARDSGALGEWIRVVNVDSKRELSGRVDAEGRVHVAF
jgi:flagella basal body P-ring formation protein FlgA